MEIKRRTDKETFKIETELLFYAIFNIDKYFVSSNGVIIKHLGTLSRRTYMRYLSELIGLGLLEDIYICSDGRPLLFAWNEDETYEQYKRMRLVKGKYDGSETHRNRLLRTAALMEKVLLEFDNKYYAFVEELEEKFWNDDNAFAREFIEPDEYYQTVYLRKHRKGLKEFYVNNICKDTGASDRNWQRDMKTVSKAVLLTIEFRKDDDYYQF